LQAIRDALRWRVPAIACKQAPTVLAFLCLAALPARAGEPLSGVLRIAGNPEMTATVARWSTEFQKQHPGIRVETHLTGSDTGMAALYAGKADVALLGRAPTPAEIQAFEWIFHYKPLQVEIMTGSVDRPGQSPAPVCFVHRDNPLANLTRAQLDAVFGTAHRLAPVDIRTWGQLGLTGEWADRPIHLYGPDAMSGTGRFFRHVVLDDSRMMNWAQLTEFSDTDIPRVATHDAGRQILAALAKDRYGLAVAGLGFSNDMIRPLAVDGIAATRETVMSRQYFLSRTILACCNRPPSKPADPLVAEFLRYVVSREGQQEIAAASAYLPLTASVAAEQAAKLD
jgi:phosphate transport system substrate-binding protein